MMHLHLAWSGSNIDVVKSQRWRADSRLRLRPNSRSINDFRAVAANHAERVVRRVHLLAGMKLPHIHPDDVRWLRRWTRNNLICVAAIVVFVSTLRLVSDKHPVRAATPRETAVVQEEAFAGNVAMQPNGWRRTRDGWQHTAWWQMVTPTQSADQRPTLTLVQERNATAMKRLRDASPLVVVLIQVIAIATIARLSTRASDARFA